MRIFTDLGRGLLAATTLAALQVACPAQAQYSPYPQTSQAYPQSTAATAQPAPSMSMAQAAAPQQQPYAYPAQLAYSPPAQPPYVQMGQQPAAGQQPYTMQPQRVAQAPVYPQYAAATQTSARPAMSQSVAPGVPSYMQPPRYTAQQPYSPPRVAMAYQNNGSGEPNAPILPQAEYVQPAPNGATPQLAPEANPAANQSQPQLGAAQNGPGCNCQGSGYESYPAGGYGQAYGACSPYSTYGYDQPGAMSRLLGKHGNGYWFGGVYGLLMQRDTDNKYPLAYANGGLSAGDYPMPGDTVLSTSDVDASFQGGVEFRLGRTFGGYDPCGCSCGPQWGLETVYWTLFENNEYAQFVWTADRTYSMMPMRGLEYNGRPIHHYTDYGTPVADYTNGGTLDEIEVRMVRARSSFEVQNLELNLLRLSVCGSGCGGGPAMCNVGCDSSGGCDSGSCATGGCATGACGTGGYFSRPSRFACTGVCGFRWMQFDESFMYGVDYQNMTNGNLGYVDYHSQTENDLIGAQIGCNGMYRIGCKWGLHLNSLVGLYGNDIDVRQYYIVPTGGVSYEQTGDSFDVRASKTDVAMMGELRAGISYQATCRLRLYGGWRAIGVSGIALATNQTPNAFLSADQMGSYVNSNGSLILHGLQTGVEWNY